MVCRLRCCRGTDRFEQWERVRSRKLRKRDNEISKGWKQLVTPLWLDTARTDDRDVDCTDTAGIFRIVQSIASPKAERVKCWLANVGYERMLEFEDPALAPNLTKSLYRAKGYSEAWIAKRMHGIAVRATLIERMEKSGCKRRTGTCHPRRRNLRGHIWPDSIRT